MKVERIRVRYGDASPPEITTPLENAMSAYRTAETLQTYATRDAREVSIANQYVVVQLGSGAACVWQRVWVDTVGSACLGAAVQVPVCRQLRACGWVVWVTSSGFAMRRCRSDNVIVTCARCRTRIWECVCLCV